MAFFVIDDLEPTGLPGGAEVRVMHGQNMTLAFFEMRSSAEIPEHAHGEEKMGTVLKGAVELTIGGVRQVVRAGQAYSVPAGVVHNGRCLESPTTILEVFSPCKPVF